MTMLNPGLLRPGDRVKFADVPDPVRAPGVTAVVDGIVNGEPFTHPEGGGPGSATYVPVFDAERDRCLMVVETNLLDGPER